MSCVEGIKSKDLHKSPQTFELRKKIGGFMKYLGVFCISQHLTLSIMQRYMGFLGLGTKLTTAATQCYMEAIILPISLPSPENETESCVL